MRQYPSEISREEYNLIREDLEGAKKTTRPRKYDLYDVFCAVLYVIQGGIQWRMLPSDYPKWQSVQHVIGSLYKSKDFPNDWGELEFKLFVFFDGKCDGLRFEWLSHPECYTVERVADTMCRCRVDSMTHMYLELNDRMEQDKFIGNAEIEFIRQFDPAAADRYAKHREDFYARRAEQERTKALARQAEKDANRAKAQAELAAEKAKYLGWVDDMTPLRFGQVSALMDTSIRVDGKIMTQREFIINCIKDGWVPQKKDGVTSWYYFRS